MIRTRKTMKVTDRVGVKPQIKEPRAMKVKAAP